MPEVPKTEAEDPRGVDQDIARGGVPPGDKRLMELVRNGVQYGKSPGPEVQRNGLE
jgi:hypothetical protein